MWKLDRGKRKELSEPGRGDWSLGQKSDSEDLEEGTSLRHY
jgi:hypothetical protein